MSQLPHGKRESNSSGLVQLAIGRLQLNKLVHTIADG